jgi:hypothetical protein
MSAKKSGGHAGISKAKNQNMAAEMKKHRVFRTSCRDPISNRIVACDHTWNPSRMHGVTS